MADGVSVVVYGRNDSHGYNLPRRAALSLNAMAEVLEDSDEILFVDCNTPNILPSFPEAISDTLTDRTRQLLRVLRIRPEQFKKLAPKSRLKVHEPLCRNVAIRRSNPKNRWILSTNTDILFLPGQGDRLGPALQNLSDGLYIAPRMELPEALWERLDRTAPKVAMETIRTLAPRWGLDLTVDCGPVIVHDGPGDFQLAPREMVFQVHGFNESIVQGWHVDGNFCARFHALTGANRSLVGRLSAYHCDHNRVATSTHVSSHQGESFQELVLEPQVAVVTEQAETWGAPGVEFEEIRLSRGAFDPFQLGWRGIAVPLASARIVSLTPQSHGTPQPIDGGAFVHLASHLETFGPNQFLLYVGGSAWMLGAMMEFSKAVNHPFRLQNLTFAEVLVRNWCLPAGVTSVVIDVSFPPGQSLDQGQVRVAIRALHRFLFGRASIQLYLVGVQNSWFESEAHRLFAMSMTPFASGVRPAACIPRMPHWKAFLRRRLRAFRAFLVK